MLTAMLFLVTACYAQAQTKVFKEVTDEISSQVKAIWQDNSLVGYLTFTRLEKISEDSFKYRISIMDENLNDIGKVEFSEIGITLKGVSFEQDVLCLAYLKSHMIGKQFKKMKAYNKALENERNNIFFQFLNLDGKIFATNSIDVRISSGSYDQINSGGMFSGEGKLKHGIQLKNISQKGFVCFYGDEDGNFFQAFDTKGMTLRKKEITTAKGELYMLTSGEDVFFLTKKIDMFFTGRGANLYKVDAEGGFTVLGYSLSDTTMEMKYLVKDKKGHDLKVLTFDINPVTGKPYLAGLIIDPKKTVKFLTASHITDGPYLGLFSIDVNSNNSSNISEVETYWNDGSLPGVSKQGLFQGSDSYLKFTSAFKDFNGNTCFAGSGVIKRVRWGCIASSVLTLWTILGPVLILSDGMEKYKVTDGLLVKQTKDGVFNFESVIPSEHSRFIGPSKALSLFDNKQFYHVINSESKSDFIVLDDPKNVTIFNVNKKLVVRTIPHKDGKIKIDVYPAKEGHIMVSEYNKKEKYTKVSIEAL